MITKEMSEELVPVLPESVRYLMDRGIKPIVCGEPIWDTLEGAARQKGYSNEQVEQMTAELALLLQKNAERTAVPRSTGDRSVTAAH